MRNVLTGIDRWRQRGVSGGCVEGAVVEIAEVVAARHARDGGRPAAAGGRIHKVPA